MALKREKSLKMFFVQFLWKTLSYLLAALLIWLVLLMIIFSNNHIITPANQTEKEVEQWIGQVQEDKKFTFEDFPQNAEYILFEQGQTQKSYQVSEADKNRIEKLMGEQADSGFQTTSIGGKYIKKIDLNDQSCIVLYSVTAQFTDPVMRKICPSVEILIFVVLVILLLTAVTISILRTSKKMELEVLKLKNISVEIEKQNLDFDMEKSSIKEFNQVLQSLDQLRENLSMSLKQQWKMEQDKKQQMSALAHDIKTPLTIIDGNAQLLLEGDLAEDEKQFSESILRSSDQIQKYVYQIIEISKDRSFPVNKVQSSVADLVSETEQLAISLAQNKDIKIELKQNLIQDHITTDMELIQRVFTNIIENAVRFTPEHGTITITFDQKNEQFQCAVTDSGPGFSKAALQQAKQEFYQDDESRSSRQHFGMGLFIAEQIVKSLDGQLLLENVPDGGARVIVTLP